MPTKKKDLENQIKNLIAINIPDFFNEYEIIIKSAGDLPDINSPLVTNNVGAAYFYHRRYPYPSAVSSLFDCVYQLAILFKEKKLTEELTEIYHGKNIVDFKKQTHIPLCLFEKKVSAEMYNPNYNFMKTIKYNMEEWKLYELEQLLAATRTRLFCILNQIIKKHDISSAAIDFFATHDQNQTETAFPEMQEEVKKNV